MSGGAGKGDAIRYASSREQTSPRRETNHCTAQSSPTYQPSHLALAVNRPDRAPCSRISHQRETLRLEPESRSAKAVEFGSLLPSFSAQNLPLPPTCLRACQVTGPQHAISLPYAIGKFTPAKKTYPEPYTPASPDSSSNLVLIHRPNLFCLPWQEPSHYPRPSFLSLSPSSMSPSRPPTRTRSA